MPKQSAKQFAQHLANNHSLAKRRSAAHASKLRELEHLGTALRTAYNSIRSTPATQRKMPYASEWVLDNYYLIERAERQIREDLPEGYYRRLPCLASQPRDTPRIYALALAIINNCQDNLSIERLTEFLDAYQQVAPLTLGELWALPTMLRIAILEILAGILSPDYEVNLPPDVDAEAVVGQGITGLRTIDEQDWTTFVEAVSLVNRTLLQDPSGTYAGMDLETRDQYRRAIESLALASGRPEGEITEAAINLAKDETTAADGESQEPHRGAAATPVKHVGFYLLGEGRTILEASVGYEPPIHIHALRWMRHHAPPFYIGTLVALTGALAAAIGFYALASGGTSMQVAVATVLVLIPAFRMVVSTVNWIITQFVPPSVLPKMDFSAGIPRDCATIVAVPVLLSSVEEVDASLTRIECRYLGNRDSNLGFALLTDFADAKTQKLPSDSILLEQVRQGILDLNHRYASSDDGPFLLFHRERQWNESEGCWLGWERKRGKLEQLNRRITETDSRPFDVEIGSLDRRLPIQYVITLDDDTELPPDTAQRLIGTMAHPLNRPSCDPETGRVAHGYTVLQPRVEIMPIYASQSMFTRIFTSDTGLDLYSRAVSDIYQDLFGEGIYVGKGIYDVQSFRNSLMDRVRENTLLSHDLFEGIHGRAGLVTDVLLYEQFPPNYLSYASRDHRWVRGDWQLLPWLFGHVPHAGSGRIPTLLSLLDRWKILDNLLRSLQTPALFTMFALGWLYFPGRPWVWTGVGLVLSGAHLVTVGLQQLRDRLGGIGPDHIERPLARAVLRWLLELAFLPYQALLTIDAISRTLVRMLITRRHLLQWTTAAHTAKRLGHGGPFLQAWAHMGFGSLIALGVGVTIGFVQPSSLPVAGFLLLTWCLSPHIAALVSARRGHVEQPLSQEERQRLRLLAYRTWHYFGNFIGPEDHWLPPDHYQEVPNGTIAHRTSPTNLGLALLATLGAHDLGYIGLMDLTIRLRFTFDAMQNLERPRGHFLNWYDTQSLRPLPPRYISTVDSGNLVACLITLRQGLLHLWDKPLIGTQVWLGIVDSLSVLVEEITNLRGTADQRLLDEFLTQLTQTIERILAIVDKPELWMHTLDTLAEHHVLSLSKSLAELVGQGPAELPQDLMQRLGAWASQFYDRLESLQECFDQLLPWLQFLNQPPALLQNTGLEPAIQQQWESLQTELTVIPTLGSAAKHCRACSDTAQRLQNLIKDSNQSDASAPGVQEALTWCQEVIHSTEQGRLNIEGLQIGLRLIASQAESLAANTDFRFLFDSRRKVFHIGYNLDAAALDPSHYDLLASESRIASIVAIAAGQVPQDHWIHLARPITQVHDAFALLSWSGTMFEYLMPTIFMRSTPGTLLDHSLRAVVREQIAYASRKGTPWGISESGYYRFDSARNYQYQAFGVPSLAFKRGLENQHVIAPYATLLALPYQPRDVLENLTKLEQAGMRGEYGLFEAIDYTHSRLPPGSDSAIVQSYMAHHQAMELLAITNALLGDTMIVRFGSDTRIRSVSHLLEERVPAQAPIEFPHLAAPRRDRQRDHSAFVEPWRPNLDSRVPQAHVLSNGRYSVVVTAAGSGYSAWRGLALTRWRPDTTRDNWGMWLYIKDADDGSLWSISRQPASPPAAIRQVIFYAHMAEFRCRYAGISARTEVAVSFEHDIEVRRTVLSNDTDRPRNLWLISFAEVALAPQADDERHQAFGKLFVESEYLADPQGLLFSKRPRTANEDPTILMHSLVTDGQVARPIAYESDRDKFLGRCGDIDLPDALLGVQPALTGTTGATLDPVMVLAERITLRPHGTTRIAFLTAAAASRETAISLIQQYRSWSAIDHIFVRSRLAFERQVQQLGLDSLRMRQAQRLLSRVLYPEASLRSAPEVLAQNTLSQSSLWGYAISGDYPIVLVLLHNQDQIQLVRSMLAIHSYWRSRGLSVDLVVLNSREEGYDQELHGQILRLLADTENDAQLNQRGGVFLVRGAQMAQADRILLRTAARVVVDGAIGSLADNLRRVPGPPTRLPAFSPPPLPQALAEIPTPELKRPSDLLFDNGFGGFRSDGREYVIYLRPGQHTPAPWINVIANPQIGFTVSESGGGYTWAGNSGENRLTAWRNDPVSDTPSEGLYLRDEETAEVWSPTPLPAPAPAPYLVRHGAGYTVFEHNSHGLIHRLRQFVAPDAAVKFLVLKVRNTWPRPRRITVTFYVEWVLGTTRSATQQYLVPQYDARSNAVFVRNTYSTDFSDRVAFVAADRPLHGLTADRTEFLGRCGSMREPAGLKRIGLAGTILAGPDPCTALQIHLDLPATEEQEVVFMLGQGSNPDEIRETLHSFLEPRQVQAAWDGNNNLWDSILNSVQVKTPQPAMDLLLNRWDLYQTVACRVWGRSALYQSSGAYGFRDQLQDVMALVHARPDLTRDHILRAAAHQFSAGDVLHWWHPPARRGVRTRISDDLLWLPYVTAHYVETTGDTTILDETVPFLYSPPLNDEENERYAQYSPGTDVGTLYEHCVRAIRHASITSPRGLPLIGAGDWNDGMNRVGFQGRGESIWLGWFLYDVLMRFAHLAEQRGDREQAEQNRNQAAQLRAAIEEVAWDGEWYIRATYDDGTPLGSIKADECQIAAIAQSWAVLSGAGAPNRARQAMAAVARRLVRENDRLIALLTPPFDHTSRDPGYIKGYAPGIRENGGQYTHAATWTAWAFAELGDGDRAEALFDLLNPIKHAATPKSCQQYQVEPYVIAADVYSNPQHVGRGGWTWYTGSAGWMYRLGVEAILGLCRRGNKLYFEPCIPSNWPGYEVTYHYKTTTYAIRIHNPEGVTKGVQTIKLDGKELADPWIPLKDDGVGRVRRPRLGLTPPKKL